MSDDSCGKGVPVHGIISFRILCSQTSPLTKWRLMDKFTIQYDLTGVIATSILLSLRSDWSDRDKHIVIITI